MSAVTSNIYDRNIVPMIRLEKRQDRHQNREKLIESR